MGVAEEVGGGGGGGCCGDYYCCCGGCASEEGVGVELVGVEPFVEGVPEVDGVFCGWLRDKLFLATW